MRKILSIVAIGIISFAGINEWNESRIKKADYNNFVNNHPYVLREHISEEDLKAIPKKDRPDLAQEQNFIATMDPALQRPAPERLYPVLRQLTNKQSSIFKTSTTTWEERGPNNFGGRTRALMIDPNDTTHKKVWAGAVAGGVWYNDDITSANSSWNSVDDFWPNLAISSLAYDPTNTAIFYAGTGEGYYNIDALRGDGIWKSLDSGSTWTQLISTSGTSTFRYIYDMAVHPITGDVYAATREGGLQRSQDGGVTWSKVLGGGVGAGSNSIHNIEISETGTIWVAVRSNGVYKSYSGNANSFTKLNSTNNGFNLSGGMQRVEIAITPADTNYCYAIVANGGTVTGLFKTTNGGSTWTSMGHPNDADPGIPATNFTRGQAWYDYVIGADPNDAENVIIGGVDLFYSSNGGTNWDQLSHWYGGFNYQYAHADQHVIQYLPGSSSEVIFGNDGGVAYSNTMNSPNQFIAERNKDYNVTQFYSAAIHPDFGSDYMLGGTQDNGSHQFTTSGINSTNEVTGGDGGFCFIDQTNPDYQLTSYTRNSHLFSADGGATFGYLNSSENSGSFINPADYHDNLDILFSGKSASAIKRTFIDGTVVPYSDDLNISLFSNTTHISVSPYSKSSATLFVGTSNGTVFKITGAEGLSPSSSNITGPNFNSGSISCIAVGSSENELLVTFSNYGINSIWYTNDGGSTWINKEGTLPDMPVRWALFNPNDYNEVIIATELGVWHTDSLNAASVNWQPINNGLAHTRVDMLQYRYSDGKVVAATHGRGFFTSDIFYNPNPIAQIEDTRKIYCVDEDVKLNSSSLNATSYEWIISPNNFAFASGSSATSKDLNGAFTADGNYAIKLAATNSFGTDTAYYNLMVGSLPLPFTEDFSGNSFIDNWKVVNSDNDITWSNWTSGGNNAAYMPNFNYVGSSINTQPDDLISPPLDLSGANQVFMHFRYAYTHKSGAQDSLALYVSPGCGEKFYFAHMMKEDGNGSFRTMPVRNYEFVPLNPNQWCGNGQLADCGYLDLTPYAAGKDNVRIMFRNFSNYGNNLYIDDIEIRTSSIGIEEQVGSNFNLYPNPATDQITIEFERIISDDLEIRVNSLDGKLLRSISINSFNDDRFKLDLSALPSGSYLIMIQTNSEVMTRKLLVQ